MRWMERGWSGGTADALFAVSGEWKSLVDSVSSSCLMSVSAEANCWMQVNQMAGNLTDQVRSIAKATVSLCILPSAASLAADVPPLRPLSLVETSVRRSRSRRTEKFYGSSTQSTQWSTAYVLFASRS